MAKKVLVYQSYGQLAASHSAIFSIITLLNNITDADNIEIWIYTDQKRIFSDFFGTHARLKIIEVDQVQLLKWRGPFNLDHRAKVEAMKDASQNFNGPLFYCDSKFFFKTSPMDLFRKVNERTSIMLKPKFALDLAKDPVAKNILKVINKHHFQIGNELVGIGPSTVLWDSEVLGICQTNKYLLDYILELMDKTCALYKKSVMEQLAFSFYLQTRSELLTVGDVIYQDSKQNLQEVPLIDGFLKANPTVEKALQDFKNFHWSSLTPIKPSSKKSLISKVFRKK